MQVKSMLLIKLKKCTVKKFSPTISVKSEMLQIGNIKVLISDLGGHQAGMGDVFLQLRRDYFCS